MLSVVLVLDIFYFFKNWSSIAVNKIWDYLEFSINSLIKKNIYISKL